MAARKDAPEKMCEQIEAAALVLLTERGYHGMSFGDLAPMLGITRANIHYHSGNKQQLVEKVLDDYVRVSLKQLRAVWTMPDATLVEKIEATARHSHNRYLKYNPTGKTGKPWSLVTQLRQNSDALTPKGRQILQRYSRGLNAMIVSAVEDAKARGEFVSWMPVQDVALQLVSIANSSGAITHDSGSFERLEQLYASFARVITLAFGHDEGKRVGGATRTPDRAARASRSRKSRAASSALTPR